MKAQIANIAQNAGTLARFIELHPECGDRLIAAIRADTIDRPTIIFASPKEHVLPVLGYEGWVRKYSTDGFGFFDWVRELDGVRLILPFAEVIMIPAYESAICLSAFHKENSAVAMEPELSMSATANQQPNNPHT